MFNEYEIKKIKNSDSRRYFEDVLQSYYSKNYKASILLLYNLLINDLYFKLQLMAEKNYVNCQKELDDIENILKEEKDSKYSLVEDKIYDVYISKKILNHSTIDTLTHFKKVRNKCAHPSFFKEYNYSPTDNETFMFINCIYNDILTVDAFFKKPYEVIKNDVENYKFPDISSVIIGISSYKEAVKDVKKYFIIKYYKYMTETNFIKLFKSLMQLTFGKKNDNTVHSQYKHYLILSSMLEFLLEIGKIQVLNNIFNWSALDDNLIYDDNEEDVLDNEWYALSLLYNICQYNPIFIDEINSENSLVYDVLKTNVHKKMSYFLEHWNLFYKDINSSIKNLSDNISVFSYKRLVEEKIDMLKKDSALYILGKLFKKISKFDAYDDSDEACNILILLIEKYKLTTNEIESTLTIMNKNRQIYDKQRKKRDAQIAKLIELNIDLSNYDNLSDN